MLNFWPMPLKKLDCPNKNSDSLWYTWSLLRILNQRVLEKESNVF